MYFKRRSQWKSRLKNNKTQEKNEKKKKRERHHHRCISKRNEHNHTIKIDWLKCKRASAEHTSNKTCGSCTRKNSKQFFTSYVQKHYFFSTFSSSSFCLIGSQPFVYIRCARAAEAEVQQGHCLLPRSMYLWYVHIELYFITFLD